MNLSSRKTIFVVVMVMSLLVIYSVMAGAYEYTARSFGMGGAFTAIADGVEAAVYNPAGMDDDRYAGIQFSGGLSAYNIDQLEELQDIDDSTDYGNVEEIVDKISGDTGLAGQLLFGAKFTSMGVAYNIEEGLFVEYGGGTDISYNNKTVREGIVSYGNNVLEPPLDLGTLSYGFNVKLIEVKKKSYDLENHLERETRGNGYGFDLGLLAKVTDNFRVGCTVENLLVSDITLKGEETSYLYTVNGWEVDDTVDYSEKEDMDANVRVGAALNIPVVDLTLALDIDNFTGSGDNGQVLHFGLEKNLLFDGLSIRAGKISSDTVNFTTLGLGLNLSGFSLDAALGKSNRKDDLTAIVSANINY